MLGISNFFYSVKRRALWLWCQVLKVRGKGGHIPAVWPDSGGFTNCARCLTVLKEGVC